MIDPLIKHIAEFYGVEHQAGKLSEECGELIAQAQRVAYGDRSEIRINCMAGEIADVLIMIEQMIFLLGIEKKVAKRKEEKIARQVRRINAQRMEANQ